MKTIEGLLDDLEDAARKQCYVDATVEDDAIYESARAAVDAEIKRMQDRIAELEEALRPFAKAPYNGNNSFNRATLSDEDFRTARRAAEFSKVIFDNVEELYEP